MDDLIRSLGWIAPVIFGVLSWLALQLRETRWGQELAGRLGLKRREHEQEWEFQRRLGSFWLSIAIIVGAFTYALGRRLLQQESDAPTWEMVVVFLGVVLLFSSMTKSVRAFWASRRES